MTEHTSVRDTFAEFVYKNYHKLDLVGRKNLLDDVQVQKDGYRKAVHPVL